MSDQLLTVFDYSTTTSSTKQSVDTIKTGKQYKLKSSSTFRLLNGWFFDQEYLYLHIYDEFSDGSPSQIFQVIAISNPLEPFSIIKETVNSVIAIKNEVESTSSATVVEVWALRNVTYSVDLESLEDKSQTMILSYRKIAGNVVLEDNAFTIDKSYKNCGS